MSSSDNESDRETGRGDGEPGHVSDGRARLSTNSASQVFLYIYTCTSRYMYSLLIENKE